jgi:hypothetical protein
VEDCEVTCDAAFHEFLEHNVCCRNSYLGPSGRSVVNLDGNARTRNFRRPKLQPVRGWRGTSGTSTTSSTTSMTWSSTGSSTAHPECKKSNGRKPERCVAKRHTHDIPWPEGETKTPNSITGFKSVTRVHRVSMATGLKYTMGGPLAQLAEQRTFNPWVVGSSPTGPTTV